MPDQPKPANIIARHVEGRVLRALTDTRIVALVGPRQSGKTTFARKIATEQGMSYVTLDDNRFRRFANDDPGGFVRGLDRAVVDGVQRAPGLILALKKTVDEDTRPGRFLVTGSVELFKGTISPDSLAGRVETVELLPFSQAEIEGRGPPSFLSRAFNADFPALAVTGPESDVVARVLTGGYPEARVRTDPERRHAWFRAYARALAMRDAAGISAVSKTGELSQLLNHAAVASGQLLNLSALAKPLGVDSKTIDRWLTLFEQMFVLRRVRAWHRNDLKRLVKTPKLHFLDTGLLAALRRVDAGEIRKDRTRLGSLLEGFVFSELARQAELFPDDVLISHYLDKDKVEVDFVLETAGKVVGVEVKAAVTVKPRDFHGLKRLKEAAGNAFACGIVMHDGERIQRVGDEFFAMSFSQVHEASRTG